MVNAGYCPGAFRTLASFLAIRDTGRGRLDSVHEAGKSNESRAGRETLLLGVCGFMGLLSVASLLAWAFRLGRFDHWFAAVGAPAILTIFVVGIWVGRTRRYPRVRTALIVGVAGGLLGTVGYDLFRIPFVILGLRLFAPIESYGVLLLGADSSSPWTHLAGWAYHFSNGLGFGIFYACVALGRKWWWGLAWAMVLETATIVTPFASTYAIRGKWGLIAIAYAAHVAYGVPLGKVVEAGDRFSAGLLSISPRPIRWILGGLAVALLLWHRPWSTPSEFRNGSSVAPGASAVVVDSKFSPDWLRIAPGGCATIRNDDEEIYQIDIARGKPSLRPGRVQKICFDTPGVHRVRTSKRPYSGGFVIVDPALAPA